MMNNKSPNLKMQLKSIIFLLIACSVYSGAVHAACNCGYDDGRFTTHSGITIDGSFADWTSVLSDLDNNSCDGGEPNIAPQPDRDAPVQSTGRDLLHFAHTWDDTHVQTYTARVASDSNVQRFIYYADVDNDGTMETGEPVIVAQWKGNNRDVRLYIGSYVESSGGGDSLVDANGYADGYTLPGTAIGFPSVGQPDYQGDWGSGDGLSMEWEIPWSVLGIPSGQAFTFHVSSTNSQPGAGSFPAQVDDNMGGCGGGAASTQYADLTFIPDRALEGQAGDTLFAAHTLTNDGNGDDTFDFASVASGDFTPAIAYYHDADGSGTYTTGDSLVTDTDGDGIPDTGLLSSGQGIDILAAYTLGSGVSGSASIVITATSSYDTNTGDYVTDTIDVLAYPDIVLMKTAATVYDTINETLNPKAIPGSEILYTIQATNQGPGPADLDSLMITDPVPDDTKLVLDIDGSGGGPVAFVDGAVSSGLTFTFDSLASATDDIAFSNNNGASYDYTPSADVDGCDANVTHLQINPKGAFNGAGGGTPSFQVQFKVKIE